jgi:hypothetical protein
MDQPFPARGRRVWIRNLMDDEIVTGHFRGARAARAIGAATSWLSRASTARRCATTSAFPSL